MERYPLEPLRTLRETDVNVEACSLRDEVERSRVAQQRSVEAHAAADEEEASNRAVERVERMRLEAGTAAVADLALAEDWRARAGETEATLRNRARQVDEELAAQRELEARTRSALARARAAAELVSRHREHWTAEAERSAELEREEEANELWTSRQGQGTR